MTSGFDLPRVPREDVDQEAELLRLQGINPHKGLIYKRMAQGEAVFDDVPMGASLLWSDDPYPDPEVTEQLVHWALQQSEEIAAVVFDFLDNPSDEAVDVTTKQLASLGIDVYKAKKRKPKALTQIILELLERKSYEVEELNEVARSLQPSSRPEAAVRQILRRLQAEKRITILDKHISLVAHD